MVKFRKCWDVRKNAWLIEHKDLKSCLAYAEFLKDFPDTDISFYAFKTQRSRLGAVPVPASEKHASTLSRPLYSEQFKKGYVRIKIAQPNVWVMKSKWIYEQANHVKLDKNQRVVFLDGDNRNFNPDNLYVVEHGTLAVVNSMFGGLKPGEVENNLVRIKQAELHRLMMKKAREAGLCNSYGGLKSKDSERSKRRWQENPKREMEIRKKCIEKMKLENPEKYAKWLEKTRAYKREYARKRREKQKKEKGIKD